MKLIPLSQIDCHGHNQTPKAFTMVDDGDFERLNKFNWQINKNGYAYRSIFKNGKRIKYIFLHHEVLGNNNLIDHINRNPLNNQKNNLRFCTPRENSLNRRMSNNNKSGFKGVHAVKSGKFNIKIKYCAFINKHVYIGIFDNPIHAAMAYDMWAKELHGEFASLNFKPIV